MIKLIWRNCKEQQIWHNNCFHLFAELLTSLFSLMPLRLLSYIYFSFFSERFYDNTQLWLEDTSPRALIIFCQWDYIKIYYVLPSLSKINYLFWWARSSTGINAKKMEILRTGHMCSLSCVNTFIRTNTYKHTPLVTSLADFPDSVYHEFVQPRFKQTK